MGNEGDFWPKFWTFIGKRVQESDAIEAACRAWHDYDLSPRQYDWDKLVSLEDSRVRAWRLRMRAALEALEAI